MENLLVPGSNVCEAGLKVGLVGLQLLLVECLLVS